MRFTLRPYQTDAIERVRQEFRAGRKRVVVVAPCGAGKTVLAVSMIKSAIAKGGQCLFLAHRGELIQQTSDKLDAIGLDHGIIKADHPRVRPWLPIQVASVQTLARRLGNRPLATLVVVDECFPAGTIVGNRRIEDIRAGDNVPSFDGTSVANRRVIRTFSSRPSGMVRLHVGKNSIACTEHHPFITQNGWISAVDCCSRMVLCNMDEQQDMPFLWSRDGKNDERNVWPLQARAVGNTKEEGAPSVHHVRKVGCLPGRQRVTNGEEQSGVLFAGMHQDLLFDSLVADHVSNEQGPCGCAERKDEVEQPDGKGGCSREGQDIIAGDGMETTCAWWERNRTNSAATCPCRVSRMADGGCGGDPEKKRERIPNKLQIGYREYVLDGCHRGRREQSLFECAESSRPKEGCALGWSRVDRVEILEPGSDGTFGGVCPDGLVYNLEVEETHTYIADGFVVHNCQHARSDSWTKVVDCYRDAAVIGLSATPYRLDGKGLGKLFNGMVVVAQPTELADMGFIMEPRIFAPDRPSLSKVRRTGGDYNAKDLDAVMNEKTLVGNVVSHWQELANEVRTVVFAVTIEHSLALRDRFRAAGVAAEHVDGEMPERERAAVLDRLRSGETRVVCNCNVLTEGFDLPELGCISLARPTQSLSLYIQMVGRALRPSPEKAAPIILDHADCVRRHGHPLEPREYSLEDLPVESRGVKKEALDRCKICKSCLAVAAMNATHCPECGERFYAAPAPVKETDSKLKEQSDFRVSNTPLDVKVCGSCGASAIKIVRKEEQWGKFRALAVCAACGQKEFRVEQPKTASTEDKRAEWNRIEAIRRSKGYARGWSWHKYKSVFGTWPAKFA